MPETPKIKIGACFAGIGGIELGLEWTGGFRTVWQIENNPYARTVLEKHWPDAKRYGDICKVDSVELEPVDIITAGFPCQDISNAGKREGIKGERSGLFFELIRLAGKIRPRWILLENVAALLNRGLDTVLGTLAEIGYNAEWHCIPAASVGAPHIRDRVFILAHPSGNGWESRRPKRKGQKRCPASFGTSANVADANGTRSDDGCAESTGGGIPGGCSTKNASDTDKPGLEIGEGIRKDDEKKFPTTKRNDLQSLSNAKGKCGRGGAMRGTGITRQAEIFAKARADFRNGTLGNAGREWWQTEPDVGRVVDGVPARVDRLRCLGNAVVPHVAQVIGKMILKAENERCR